MTRRSMAWLVIASLIGLGSLAAEPIAAQTLYDTSPPAQTGEQNYGSYFSADVDQIGLYNGNVSVRLNLLTLPGRELGVSVSLGYNNQEWELQDCSGVPCGLYTGGWHSDMFGTVSFFAEVVCEYVGIGPFQQYQRYWYMNGYWVDGLGTKHRYLDKVDTGLNQFQTEASCLSNPGNPPSFDDRELPSLDSDGSVLDAGTSMNPSGTTPPVILFKDGRELTLDGPYCCEEVRLETANGNYLHWDMSSEGAWEWQDTLGRTLDYVKTTLGAGAWKETYTVDDANGNPATYTVWTDQYTVYDPHKEANVTQSLVSDIDLPNGKSYAFEYDHDQGFLTKLVFPSGAYVRYVYVPSDETSPDADYITQRRVSEDGTTGSEKVWQYSRSTNDPARTVTVTSPVGDKVLHYFTAQGTEYKTEWKNSSDTLLKTVDREWTQTGVETNDQPNNPRVDKTTTSLDTGMKSVRTVWYDSDLDVTKEEVRDWGLGPLAQGNPAIGVLVLRREIGYDWFGSVKRKTSELLWGIRPDNPNIFTWQQKTEFFYDEYSLTVRSGVPNHTGNTSASDRGNLTTTRQYKTGWSAYIDTHLKYDSVGNVVETIDGLGSSSYNDFSDNYDDSTNRNSYAFVTEFEDSLGETVITEYNYDTGLPVTVTDRRGYSATTTYDELNRIVTLTAPNGAVTTSDYDDTNLITTVTRDVDSSGNEAETITYVDGFYRPVRVTTVDPDGNIAVDTEYDDNGRVHRTSNPYRLGSESPVWTETSYDGIGRAVEVEFPDGSTVQTEYTNNVKTTVDQAGNARRYTHNVLGQLVLVEEPYPTLDTPLVTNYTYYVHGALYRTEQSAQTRTFVHDPLGRKTSETTPEAGTTTFAYNDNGWLTSETDARSITTSYTYDDRGQLTQRSYSDSTPTVQFEYDEAGNRTEMTDALGTVTYTHDDMGRLTAEDRTLTGVAGTFSTDYAYDLAGNLISITYPSGRTVDYAYEASGGNTASRLATVDDDTTGVALADGLTYHAAGAILTRQMAIGGSDTLDQAWTYNSRLQLTQITADMDTTSLMELTYAYGSSSQNTGRILSQTDAIQAEHSASYTYDAIHRLQQVVGGNESAWGIAWEFDVWGNRTDQSPTGLASSKVGQPTMSYTNNRLTGASYTYDSAGNLTSEGVHSYFYNAENQLTQTTSASYPTTTYGYDGDGRRMKKTVGSDRTFYFYAMGQLVTEFSTTDTGATASASTDRVAFNTADTRGSAVLIVEQATGLVIENNRTLPYGEDWLHQVESDNEQRFTSYLRDDEADMDYAINRYMVNRFGRFASIDPGAAGARLRYPQTWNAYVYTINDPINHTDPDGMEIACGEVNDTLRQVCRVDVVAEAPPSAFDLLVLDQWRWVEESWKSSSTFQYMAQAFLYQEMMESLAWMKRRAEQIASRAAEHAAKVAEQNRREQEMAQACMDAGFGSADCAYLEDVPVMMGVALPPVAWGHGARHAAERGISSALVESAIMADLTAIASSSSAIGSFWGTVTVQGVRFIYKAYNLPHLGFLNIGTYFAP